MVKRGCCRLGNEARTVLKLVLWGNCCREGSGGVSDVALERTSCFGGPGEGFSWSGRRAQMKRESLATGVEACAEVERERCCFCWWCEYNRKVEREKRGAKTSEEERRSSSYKV